MTAEEYANDPGGNFETDAHRRVCAHLPVPEDDPITLAELFVRIWPDQHTPIPDEVALALIVEDLVKLEYVEKVDNGLKQTTAGYETLCGPVEGEEPKDEG